MKIKGISSAMYGWMATYWKQGLDPRWDEIYRDCAASGLNGVEIEAATGDPELLRANGLAVSSAYIGLPLHEPYETLPVADAVIPLARRLAEAGGADLVVNADPKGGWDAPQPKSEDEFKRQGENLSRIADAVSGLGLRISMHNHASDRHNAEGDLRSVLDYADPLVGLCIDTGWAHVAGCDPAQLIRANPGRIYAFHLRNQLGNVSTEDLLSGEIDMRDLIAACAEIGYEGWLVLELLPPDEYPGKRTMSDNTALSVQYLKQLLEAWN
ncbi:xylose isomerase-like TIM barrel-containing protein [Paenibacillus sp. 32O-W]|uniref:sugar phosphate isomerase/epimerase family protein n=1 Tax=Paenibacillus sp. 32O-W TaxID=1695218 RepID=UPI000721A73C|nr:sugar phosphate isomerase/epimerase [Paenibacillus sp. 32O-W]ALS28699.1 xylose isomerase-like TIM barrel-containing protein [Paenibacillus sp. 32O-W]